MLFKVLTVGYQIGSIVYFFNRRRVHFALVHHIGTIEVSLFLLLYPKVLCLNYAFVKGLEYYHLQLEGEAYVAEHCLRLPYVNQLLSYYECSKAGLTCRLIVQQVFI